MASTDKITDVYNAARPNSARATATRAVGGTTLTCDDLTGWPTASKVHFATYQIDSNSDVVAGTQADWEGEVSGSSIGSLVLRGGTDNGNASGDVVEMLPTAAWAQDLADGINLEHSRAGAHEEELITSRTADTSPASGDLVLTSDASDSNNLKKVTLSNLFTNIGGLLGSIQTYTASDTWTKPSGLKFVIAEVVGGGGGGGGADGNTSSVAAGGGGGAGGYSRKKIAAASLGATETVTVGALGAGGTAGPNDGSDGGTTSFGAHCSATAGGGGAASGPQTTDRVGGNGETAGVGSGGDLNLAGSDGWHGIIFGTGATTGVAGRGGDSFYGKGGFTESSSASTTGNPGTGYGSGGSGGLTTSNVDRAGGDGAAGIVIVYEYF